MFTGGAACRCHAGDTALILKYDIDVCSKRIEFIMAFVFGNRSVRKHNMLGERSACTEITSESAPPVNTNVDSVGCNKKQMASVIISGSFATVVFRPF